MRARVCVAPVRSLVSVVVSVGRGVGLWVRLPTTSIWMSDVGVLSKVCLPLATRLWGWVNLGSM